MRSGISGAFDALSTCAPNDSSGALVRTFWNSSSCDQHHIVTVLFLEIRDLVEEAAIRHVNRETPATALAAVT